MRMSVLAALLAAVSFPLAAGTAQADTIDFEGLTGPQLASQATAQTLSVSTSIGMVTFSGGAILTHAAELPADATSVYATSSSMPGGVNPIVITLPSHVLDFSVDFYNGMDTAKYLKAADYFGFSGSALVPSGALLGEGGVYFIRAGNVVTVTQLGGGPFDFAIDNLSFNPLPQAAPQDVPAPTPFGLFCGAFAALARVRRRR